MNNLFQQWFGFSQVENQHENGVSWRLTTQIKDALVDIEGNVISFVTQRDARR